MRNERIRNWDDVSFKLGIGPYSHRKDYVHLSKVNLMSEQNHPQEKPEMVSEADLLVYPDITRIKTSIIQTIQQSEDETLLQEIYELLQSEKTKEKPLKLARHIDKIFAQYPETLSKLAQ
jgi:hypothetical protein